MEQTDILRHTVNALEQLNVPYLVVGSITCIAYGEARFTQDIDIVAAFEMRHLGGILAAFPSDEFYLSESAIRDSIRIRLPCGFSARAAKNRVAHLFTKKWL